MRRVRPVTCLSAAMLIASELGCGNFDPADSDEDAEVADAPLLPLKTGNSWTYRVTSDGEVTSKVQTVGEEETVGGQGPNADAVAFRMLTNKGVDLMDQTTSWQTDLGDRVVRYREQSFHASTGELELEEHWDPYKLRVSYAPEQLEEGASYLEQFTETKLPTDGTSTTTTEQAERWQVVSLSEEVSVPAGTFQAVRLRRSGTTSQKTYWFVPGVGKVKEEGTQVEELVSYEVAP